MKNKGKKEVVKLPQAKSEEAVPTVAEKARKSAAILNPIVTACSAILAGHHKDPRVDTDYLQQTLRLKANVIIDGDMKAVEELLITQSYVLNSAAIVMLNS